MYVPTVVHALYINLKVPLFYTRESVLLLREIHMYVFKYRHFPSYRECVLRLKASRVLGLQVD